MNFNQHNDVLIEGVEAIQGTFFYFGKVFSVRYSFNWRGLLRVKYSDLTEEDKELLGIDDHSNELFGMDTMDYIIPPPESPIPDGFYLKLLDDNDKIILELGQQ